MLCGGERQWWWYMLLFLTRSISYVEKFEGINYQHSILYICSQIFEVLVMLQIVLLYLRYKITKCYGDWYYPLRIYTSWIFEGVNMCIHVGEIGVCDNCVVYSLLVAV